MDKPIMGWGWQLLVQFHECTKAERWLHRKTALQALALKYRPGSRIAHHLSLIPGP